jgi:hypothetical protein
MPQTGPPDAEAAERLDSWKEIAAYLKRDVRTVRRWESTEDLPVHRHLHGRHATVYAFRSELDTWQGSRESVLAGLPRPQRRAWAVAALAALVLVLVLLASWLLYRDPGSLPASPARISSRLLAAVTGEGQQLLLIPVEGLLSHLVMSPDGAEVYGSDPAGKAIRVIRTDTNQLSHSIPLPATPGQLLFAPGGDRLYVGTLQGEVLAVHRESRTVETLARGLEEVRDMALTADGRTLYITAIYRGLHRLDLQSGVLREVPTLRCPVHLSTVPGKALLYVAHQCGGPGGRSGHDAIDVRDARTAEAVATLVGPPHVGREIVASPDGSQVWADGHDACRTPGYDHVGCPAVPGGIVNIWRVDDHRLLASLGLPGDQTESAVAGISFVPDGSRAVLGGQRVRVVDVSSLRVVEELPLVAGAATFTPDGRRAYLPLSGQPYLAVLDLGASSCLPPPPGLAVWWPGDGNAADIRNGNQGALHNGAHTAPAWVGQGFELDGEDDYLSIPALYNVETTADFSLSLWVKPAASGRRAQTLLDYAPPGRTGWRLDREQDGRVSLCYFQAGEQPCAGPARLTSAHPVPAGQWSHVVAVNAPHRLLLYLNGEADAAAEVLLPPAPSGRELRIGGSFTAGRHFAGMLDEIQMFRRPLSEAEARRLFQAARAGLCYQ